MKKYVFLIVTMLMVLACAHKDPKGLSLTGTIKGVSSGKVYLQKFDNKMYHVIDSSNIVDGKFSFSTEVQLPEIYGLTLDPKKSSLLVFLDKGAITVKLDSASYYRNSEVTGSELQNLFVAYKSQKGVKIDEFIREHPKSLVSAYILYRDFSYRLSPLEIKSYIRLLDSSLWDTPYVKTVEALAKTLEVVSIGREAPDFTVTDVNGDVVTFSDHLGKGYVLLDFWASWCGPCRRENPNIVNAYQKYKDKGFDIFAVSLDKEKSAWVNAIEQDGLTWVHTSDLLYWNSQPAKLYGVRAIPANFLIDSKGVIVAKNLKEEALDKVLSELLIR